jgi:hypothetical protein
MNTVTLPAGDGGAAASAPAPRPAPPAVPFTAFTPAPAAPRPTPVPPPQPSVSLPVAGTTPAPAPAPKPATPPPILSREPGDIDLKPVREEAYVKRIVTREGIVRRTLNVQAPSFYVLENLHNGRVMDYLYTSNTNLNLGSYRGRVVNVTGEEALDERWPNVPVIRVETLHTSP